MADTGASERATEIASLLEAVGNLIESVHGEGVAFALFARDVEPRNVVVYCTNVTEPDMLATFAKECGETISAAVLERRQAVRAAHRIVAPGDPA